MLGAAVITVRVTVAAGLAWLIVTVLGEKLQLLPTGIAEQDPEVRFQAMGDPASFPGALIAVAVSRKKALSEKDLTDDLRLSRIGVVLRREKERSRVQPAS